MLACTIGHCNTYYYVISVSMHRGVAVMLFLKSYSINTIIIFCKASLALKLNGHYVIMLAGVLKTLYMLYIGVVYACYAMEYDFQLAWEKVVEHRW